MTDMGSIGRRAFLAGSAAAAAALHLPLKGFAAEPSKGGTFRLGIADYATVDTLNPTMSETRFQLNLGWQLRNNLVEVGPGGTLVPELAVSWEGSGDAKTWVVKLRQGVEFHNGKTLTPEDVIYSINLHRAEGTTSGAKPFVAPIEEIKVGAPDEVIFTLKSGNVGFPSILAHYALTIVPADETDFDGGLGTGGYILETFEPGVRSLVKRNPNYWKAGAAHFDSVELIGIKDVSARTSALVSGEIDAYNFVDLKTIGLLERQSNVKVQRVAGKTHYVFAMLCDAAPFTDKNVRQAMKYAIDREEILAKILNGYGTVGNDQPINGAYQYYDAALEQRTYDPDQAKFYLKQAGLGDVKAKLHVSELPFAGAADAAQLFREQAAPCGIDIEVVREPEDGYWSNVWTQVPFFAARWSGRINEDVMIATAYSSEAMSTGWNETHIQNERLDMLLEAGRTEFDDAKRAEIYAELQALIRDESGAIIPVFADIVDAASDKVAHGELSSDWDLDGGRASERWWFA